MQTVGDYEFRSGELIGHGAFALVFKGQHKQSHLPVAIKQILLKNIPGKLSVVRKEEISILKNLKHPNIVQLYYYQETSAEIYLVMEFCNGGDLAEYLQNKKTLAEESIRHLIRHMAEALQVIHQRHIIHRDIKPQNLLLSFPHTKSLSLPIREATIKLADFGFARYLTGADMAATLCGSPLYMAPEILLGQRYDSKADLWSTGTILFQSLTGSAPFEAPNPHALRRRYAKENLVPRIPKGTSPCLTDLLMGLLKKNPVERLAYDALVRHPFLQSEDSNHDVLLKEQSISTLHAKSSPVPIQRKRSTNQTQGYPVSSSPHSSPHSGHSSRRYFSPSSGPPAYHNIESNSSLPYVYSPPTTKDIEQGFVLVDKTRDSSSSSSREGSYHSQSSLTYQQQLCGPLTELKSSKQTPPTSLSPSLTRRDTPPFSSLVKLGGAVLPGSSPTSPCQATPSSLGSSPVVKLLPSPSSGSGPSRFGSARSSCGKLAVLLETESNVLGGPPLVDSTELVSESLLMNSDVLQKGLDNLLENKVKSSPENLFHQLQLQGEGQSGDVSGCEQRNMFKIGDKGLSLESSSLDEGLSEEMFALQLEEDTNDKGLFDLTFSFAVAQELLKLAKSRQGPMLLLSSSMGDSGRMLDHAQRFSEQLILCVKAARVIEDGCKQYEIALAVSSMEPHHKHKSVFDEARKLREHCLDKAQLARELYSKCVSKRRQSLPQAKVTAEKLIFLQAIDMCKQAVLEENLSQKNESARRYRLSLLLLRLLLSDAVTERDRLTLKKYETSVQTRLKTLSNISS